MNQVAMDNVVSITAENFSLWSLFWAADWVVKAVLIGLLLASIASWTIIFREVKLLNKVKQKAKQFEAVFWSGESLQKFSNIIEKNPGHPMARVFLAGMKEWVREKNNPKHLSQYIDRTLGVSVAREISSLEQKVSPLATIGAISPFVGLFGTVWGIMNSFQAIAMNNETNLSVVAPGIAEALFATALGLMTAIPAVVAYNKLTADIKNYAGSLDNFADEFSVFLLRQINNTLDK